MSAARFTKHGGHRLVLLQGGLELDARDHDPDWHAFARRIGWQSDVADAPDGLEDRVAARLASAMRGEPDAGRTRADEPPTVSAARVVDVAFDGANTAWRTRVGARHVPLVAATLAVAAAVLLVVATVMSMRSPPPGAFLAEPAREDTRPATTPTIDPVRPVTTPPDARSIREDVGPDVPRPTKTAPTKDRQTPKPLPPGAEVAARRAESVSLAAYRPSVSFTGVASATFAVHVAPAPTTSSRVDFGDGTRTIARPGVAAIAPVRADRLDRSLSGSASADPSASVAHAAWALSPENARIVGASVAPSGGPGMPGGVGVVAQIDLSKAFNKL